MEIIIISVVAFLTAILTFFSGFGLGTILTPVFLFFFPVDLAIALTGVVHFGNNIFKLILIGRKANVAVLLRFGIPAVIAAFAGAWLLINLPDAEPLFTHGLFAGETAVTPVKFIIALLLIIFAVMELMPSLKNMEFGKQHMPIGGILSGFFGGLSGNQGALRSAFLIKAGLTKEVFIGTTVVISCFVDFTRLSVYATRFADAGLADNLQLILFATVSAMAGAMIGKWLLKKVTLRFIQLMVAILLIAVSLALGSGLL
jgi:uncharacterized membrane protein YfcA